MTKPRDINRQDPLATKKCDVCGRMLRPEKVTHVAYMSDHCDDCWAELGGLEEEARGLNFRIYNED